MSEFSRTQPPLLLQRAVLSIDSCRDIRLAMDRGTQEAADIVTEQIVTEDTIRRTRSIEVDADTLEFMEQQLESLRPEIEHAIGRRLGPREGPGFLRYPPGGFYLPHRDRGDVRGWPAAARRAVAVVLFLNSSRDTPRPDEFSGGTLWLHPAGHAETVSIRPEAGIAIAFAADVLHEVRPVHLGTRDTAIDWFYDGA